MAPPFLIRGDYQTPDNSFRVMSRPEVFFLVRRSGRPKFGVE